MQTNSVFTQPAASSEATRCVSVLGEVLFSLVAATCHLLWVDVCSCPHKCMSAIQLPRLEAILQNVIISSSVNALPLCFHWRRGLSAEERKIINYKDHHQVENQFCLHFWISHLMWMEYGTVLTANDAPPGSAWSSDLWNPLATGTSGGKWGN